MEVQGEARSKVQDDQFLTGSSLTANEDSKLLPGFYWLLVLSKAPKRAAKYSYKYLKLMTLCASSA
jgi:hypothetical protein